MWSTCPNSSSSAFAHGSPSNFASRPDRFLRLVFAGTPKFAERALSALHHAGHQVVLVLTQPDRPAGRGQQPAPSPVKCFAQDHGLALLQPSTLQSNETVERVIAAGADAMVVAAYGLILPAPYLAATGYGALNIHASLLPRWRGAAPIQRALLAGDVETGVSIMQMDMGLDTGPVLAQQRVAIAEDDDAGTLHDKLASLGAEMMVAVLANLQSGTLSGVPQLQSGASYARKVGKKETVLVWSRPAQELEREVRAFRPSPGASTLLGGEPLKVWRARVREQEGEPGVLLGIEDGSLIIGCGRQALEVTEIQRPGGRRLPTAEFLRGREVEPGTRFG